MEQQDLKNLLYEIRHELKVYRTNGDPETTNEDWVEIFYTLLCKVDNLFEGE